MKLYYGSLYNLDIGTKKNVYTFADTVILEGT